MNLAQNVCLNYISDVFVNGSCWVKLCVCFRGHIFSPILMELGQSVCLNDIGAKFENASCHVKDLITMLNCK